MRLMISFFLITFLLFSCRSEPSKAVSKSSEAISQMSVRYAKGFEIKNYGTYKIITLKNPWPGAEQEFKYALIEKNTQLENVEEFDAIIKIPIESIVVTSTTHIPSLEMLGVENTLVGFPHMNYISSEATRKRIEEGKIKELGINENINTEVLIDINPNAVVGFAVDGSNAAFTTIEQTGIPVIYNADWTETSPLGKAEWIKFFGALYDKNEEAETLFSTIEKNYNDAKKQAEKAINTPSVLSGAMYKDVWYLPQGDSWAARFIEDANGNYLWKDSKGTGSLSLNLESVLEKGKTAQFWIGPSQFTDMQQLKDAHSVYSEFAAFKNENVYSFTNNKGATGGVLYYELASNRPDIVLKDIIKILHPELLPEHSLYFFSKLN